MEELNVLFMYQVHVSFWDPVWPWPDLCTSASRDQTCVYGCSSPAHSRLATPSAAGGCWSTGRGPWRWWPSWWSPAPARIRWNSGWRKYCALPAMRNKEINKKAKAPLRRRSAQLDYNRLKSQVLSASLTKKKHKHRHCLKNEKVTRLYV